MSANVMDKARAAKAAAERIGLPVAEYEAHQAAGERGRGHCRAFHAENWRDKSRLAQARFSIPAEAEPIKTGKPGRPANCDPDEVRRLFDAGKSRFQIAFALGCSYYSVCRVLKPEDPPDVVEETDPKYLCGCGCGKGINPNVRRVHELLAQGKRVMEISRTLGIDKVQVANFRDRPPRFRKGHAVKGRPKTIVKCANPNCDNLFSKQGDNHLYCTYASRGGWSENGNECARLAFEHKQNLWKQYDEGVGERAAQRLIASERRTYGIVTATLDEMAQVGADYEAAAAIARQAITIKRLKLPTLKYPQAEATMERLVAEHRRDLTASVDHKIATLMERVRWRTKAKHHDATIVAQAISRSPELAELIAEQERDARWGDRMPKWVLSLQRKVGEDGTMGDLIPSPDSDDPYQTMLGQLLRECLAGRDLDDIEALDDWTREWLQNKLIESGLSSAPLVKAGERRLWLPAPTKARTSPNAELISTLTSLGGLDPTGEYEDTEASVRLGKRSYAITAMRAKRFDREILRRERAAEKRKARADKVAAMRER